MRLKVSCSIIFLLLNVEVSISANDAIVEIQQGRLEGKIVETVSKSGNYYSFKGIPYAEPPVGELRFMPPKPHQGWEGTLNAFKHGNICKQLSETSDDQFGDEDCLFLNVYTPRLKANDSKKTLPVMFFIHGGMFRYGSGNSDFYGPDYLMEEDVILVTVNYRLGVLGFLDLENDMVTGNMGLKDVFLALKWVKNNIKKFGGDPDNVTIFGQGSGAVIVDILYLSPIAKNFFQKAILQSETSLVGSYFDWKPRERAFTLTEFLDKKAVDDDSLIRILREATAGALQDNLLRTLHPDETIFKQIGISAFSPTLSNRSKDIFITKLPEELIENGELPNKDIPLMIGFNSQESILDNRFYIIRPHFISNLKKRFPFVFPLRGIYAEFDSEYHYEVHYRIKWFYFNVTIDISKDTVLEEFLNYNSDHHVIPVDKSVKVYAKANDAPVYFYRFSYDGEFNYFKKEMTKPIFDKLDYPVNGASEKDELCYIFKCDKIKDLYKKAHAQIEESKDLKNLKKIVRLWTNFAKTGNPTPENDNVLEGLKWKPAVEGEQHFLDLDEEFTNGLDPHNRSVEFWDAMYDYYRPLATDGILIDPPKDTDEEHAEDVENKNDEPQTHTEGEKDTKDEL